MPDKKATFSRDGSGLGSDPAGVSDSNPSAIQETVAIRSGDATLAGELQIPAGAAGIVLFAHGSGSSRHSPRNQFVARTLRDAGIGTLLFDLLTREEDAQDEDTGRFRFDVSLLARRLIAAAASVAGRDATRHFGLGCFGASTGSAAALIAAASLGVQIDAVVSRGGRPDLAREVLPQVQAPTLLIVGSNDEVVLRWNREALERLPCEKELAIVPGATHLFEEPGALNEVARLASVWFRRHLRLR